MTRYIVTRILSIVPSIVTISIVVFVVMRLIPGDPVLALAGAAQTEIRPELLEGLRREYGLDQPYYIQYIRWTQRLLAGDLGRSIRSGQPVAEIVFPRLIPTLQIGILAWLLAMALSIPIGIVSAMAPNSWKDWLGTTGALVGVATPYFLLGGILIYVFALTLRWLPASGYVLPTTDLYQSLRSSVLPVLTLGLGLAAITTRQTRASMLEVLQQPYITTAHAKGLRQRVVLIRHGLKNALLPVVTILGVQLVNIFGGAVITETIFAVPGMGRLLVETILSRDYPILQAAILVIAVCVALVNLLVDILYVYLDPRIRLEE